MEIKTPPPHLKLKFLKISAIRLNVSKQHLSEDRFKEVLNKAISESRVIING